MEKEFTLYEQALELEELGFDEPCFGRYYYKESYPMLNPRSKETELVFELGQYLKQTEVTILAPTFSQAINFLYICSNKQIDIELKVSDTYEERIRKVAQGCKDLRNLQNSKSN